MEIEDYRTWRLVPDDRTDQLLDPDTGEPTKLTFGSKDEPIARVAATLHATAASLSTEDCERIIGWLKTVKRERLPQPPSRDIWTFDKAVGELRDSPSQTEMMRKAYRHGRAASAWAVLAFVIAGTAVACALAPGIGWFWAVITFVIAIVIYIRGGQRRLFEAALVWKEQEQRHLWESIRAARTVQELSHAGLFAFLSGASFGPGYDEATAVVAMRRERDRLTDALYYDPDWWLRD